VFPLKDNIPTDRLPIVTILLIAGGVAAHILLSQDGGLLRLLTDALFLGIFGPSVEDSMSRPRFLLLCVLGGAVALAVRLALDPTADALAPAASAGVVAAVVAGYALRYRRARVVSVVLVPFMISLVEVPAWILLALWPVLQAAFGEWALFAAQAGGLVVGLLTIRALAQRRKQVPPRLLAAQRIGAAS